jgi:hypothetical protein
VARRTPSGRAAPIVEIGRLRRSARSFLEGSRFNNHLSAKKCRAFPKNVGELLRKLDGKRKFPFKERVPMQRQLRELL